VIWNLFFYTMNFKNKRILITAGPTWVAIDKIRVMSNIASGQTGILLASRLNALGAKITLILGPVGSVCCFDKKIKVLRFRYFDELKDILFSELMRGRYDAVIHSAAVSDYKPRRPANQKISSGLKSLKITLIPTVKLVDSLKKLSRRSFTVAFKLEPGLSRKLLINEARKLLKRASLDAVVANSIDYRGYRAMLVTGQDVSAECKNKFIMTQRLVKLIGEGLCRN
jgi:phosphopantothenoylcysteine decarboxylase / phosphopantothenate---cysteine ligase